MQLFHGIFEEKKSFLWSLKFENLYILSKSSYMYTKLKSDIPMCSNLPPFIGLKRMKNTSAEI